MWHNEHGMDIMDARTTNLSESLLSTYETLYNALGAEEAEALWLEWYGITSQSRY